MSQECRGRLDGEERMVVHACEKVRMPYIPASSGMRTERVSVNDRQRCRGRS